VSVPLEAYVARVLGGEAAPATPPAAMEALAIAIRTYALANLDRHRAEGFDLCDQTDCQVMRTPTPATERAAQATAGLVLMYKGAPASIFYSASCGGFSEVPSAVWPGADDVPYLPARKDSACDGEPEWAAELSRAELQRVLERAGFQGEPRNLRILSRDKSGRVERVRIEGVSPSEVTGPVLRTAFSATLGPLVMRSTMFDVKRSGDRFRFSGHGYGHGVGMCVMGAVQLASSGERAEEILARYFPGLDIRDVRQSDIAMFRRR
jgi:stage II sporulation protein D